MTRGWGMISGGGRWIFHGVGRTPVIPFGNLIKRISYRMINVVMFRSKTNNITKMAYNKTPTKSSTAYTSSPRTPQYGTPTSRGKPELLSGYIAAVGNEERSRKGNEYYNIVLQVSKSQLVIITVMKSAGNLVRTEALSLLDHPVTLENVFPGGDCFFYYRNKGSHYEIHEDTSSLEFGLTYALTTIADLLKKPIGGVFNVRVMLRWMNDDSENRRNAMIADETHSIRFSAWKDSWFKLEENVVYVFTGLVLKEFFGMKLDTANTSCYRQREEVMNPNWPDNIKELCNIDEEEVLQVDKFCGVSLSSAGICPGCHAPIPFAGVSDQTLECDPCDKLFSPTQVQMSGTIDIEMTTGAILTLSFTDKIVESLFGAGTVKPYALKRKELRKQIMGYDKTTVTFGKKSKKITSIVKQADAPPLKMQKLDNKIVEMDSQSTSK